MLDSLPVFLAQQGFDWEGIVPVLFLILYGIFQFFGSRNEAKKQREKAKRAARGEETESSEPRLSEEARRIQEEIRRKIAERQAAARGESAPQRPMGPAKSAQRPAAASFERSGRSSMRTQEETDRSRDMREPSRRREQPSAPPPFQENRLASALREQQDRVEASRRERDAALSKARAMASSAERERVYGLNKDFRPSSSSVLRADILAQLKDPNGARKAILYSEILGQPLASRREGQAMWEQ